MLFLQNFSVEDCDCGRSVTIRSSFFCMTKMKCRYFLYTPKRTAARAIVIYLSPPNYSKNTIPIDAKFFFSTETLRQKSRFSLAIKVMSKITNFETFR